MWWRGLAFAAVVGPSTTAWASDVQVTLAEDPAGVTVRIRGVDPGAMADKIVTSKHGALLFVPGDDAPPQRMRPLDRHRLDYVQIGRAGDRIAVRVVQRKKSVGSLSRFMRTTAVAGGFDVRIEDAAAKPVTAPASAVAAAPSADPSFDRDAALSKFAPHAIAAPPVAAVVHAPAPTPIPTPTSRAPQAPAAPAAAVAAPVAPTSRALAPGQDSEPAIVEAPAANDDGTRPASASADSASLDLGRSAPKIGMAWLATAVLAFSGLGMLWWRKRRPTLEAAQPLRVIARVAIGPKQQVVWIQANGRSLLVGATEQRIDLLADLAADAQAAVSSPTVATAMNIIAPPAAAAAPVAPTPPESTGRVAAFKQRLRAALGDELAGRNDEPPLPPHLEMLAGGEPRWIGRKESA
jgi:flagellar biogenesis protein FliO